MPPRHSMRPYRVSLSRSAESRRVFCPCLAGDIKVKTNLPSKSAGPPSLDQPLTNPIAHRVAGVLRVAGGERSLTAGQQRGSARDLRAPMVPVARAARLRPAPVGCRNPDGPRSRDITDLSHCAANPDQHGPMSLTPPRSWSIAAAPRAAGSFCTRYSVSIIIVARSAAV